MVAAIVWGTVLHYLLITFCYAATRIRYSQVRASGPRRPPVGVDELDPYELALLAGGRPRVGEVAVAELFLTGRITAWGPGMVAGVAQQSAPAPPGLSDSPFVWALSVRLAVNRPLAVDRLVSAATCGDAITAVLWRLRRLGLFLPPERLRAMAVLRRAAWLSQLVLGAVTVLAAGFLVGWTVSSAPANRSLVPLLLVVLLGYPFLLHVAFRAAGGLGAVGMAALVVAVSGAVGGFSRAESLVAAVLFGGWFVSYAAYWATGGRLGPRTVAGDVLLAEARAELAARRDVRALLQATAVVGLRGLRAGKALALGSPRVGRLIAFATACASSFGAVDRGVGGDFGWDGRRGNWMTRGEVPPLPSPPPRDGHHRDRPPGERP